MWNKRKRIFWMLMLILDSDMVNWKHRHRETHHTPYTYQIQTKKIDQMNSLAADHKQIQSTITFNNNTKTSQPMKKNAKKKTTTTTTLMMTMTISSIGVLKRIILNGIFQQRGIGK